MQVLITAFKWIAAFYGFVFGRMLIGSMIPDKHEEVTESIVGVVTFLCCAACVVIRFQVEQWQTPFLILLVLSQLLLGQPAGNEGNLTPLILMVPYALVAWIATRFFPVEFFDVFAGCMLAFTAFVSLGEVFFDLRVWMSYHKSILIVLTFLCCAACVGIRFWVEQWQIPFWSLFVVSQVLYALPLGARVMLAMVRRAILCGVVAWVATRFLPWAFADVFAQGMLAFTGIVSGLGLLSILEDVWDLAREKLGRDEVH